MSGVLATAFAVHATVVPVSVAEAVPATFNPPAQVALNDPIADVGVCCVGVQLKSVQLEGDGSVLAVADFHEPTRPSTVVALGFVIVVLFSYPTQALAATHVASAQAKM
jgi:hypothetical protein